jgi:hypothetical protein
MEAMPVALVHHQGCGGGRLEMPMSPPTVRPSPEIARARLEVAPAGKPKGVKDIWARDGAANPRIATLEERAAQRRDSRLRVMACLLEMVRLTIRAAD